MSETTPAEFVDEYESDSPESVDLMEQAIDPGCVRQSVDGSAMSASFILVTRKAEANLHGNKVQIGESEFGRGANLTHHMTAPIVLFEHGRHSPYPIGVSRSPAGEYTVSQQKTQMKGTVYFSQANPEAELVFAMVDEGIIGMASIGFRATKLMRFTPKKQKLKDGVVDVSQFMGGMDFVEWLLVEWSIVARGADPGSVRQVLDHGGLNGARVTPTLVQSLTSYAEEKKIWTPSVDIQSLSGEANPKQGCQNSDTLPETKLLSEPASKKLTSPKTSRVRINNCWVTD